MEMLVAYVQTQAQIHKRLQISFQGGFEFKAHNAILKVYLATKEN